MYLGADLSYVNEVEDCGGIFYEHGRAVDPFALLQAHGANIVRVRLWHTPTWTAYSNLPDVQRTIRRAKALGLTVLLDFHYSDTWADPGKQIIPAAWESLAQPQLEQAMYDYTLTVLVELHKLGLMPDFVQVGNEINTEILRPENTSGDPINWQRNAPLINAGIAGVRAAGQQTATQPRVMLHIAQPENLFGWFDAALAAGVTDFDQIGMSYYPKWSTCSVEESAQMLGAAGRRYGKETMIVETAYPFTQETGGVEDHLLGRDAVTPTYPASPEGQHQFLRDRKSVV
jgi:Arabinogalactan endo-1,4-beta-galactosidase